MYMDMDIEKFTKYVEEINERIREKLKDDEEMLQFYSRLVFCLNAICKQNKKQKEVIDKVKNVQIEMPKSNYSYDYMIYRSKIDEILKEVSR